MSIKITALEYSAVPFDGRYRHGAGRWKQISEDNEFPLQSRTAVNLKDRWRVIAKGVSMSNGRKEMHSARMTDGA